MNIDDIEILVKRNCFKCRYAWWPRGAETKRCPRCQVWLLLDQAKDSEETLTTEA